MMIIVNGNNFLEAVQARTGVKVYAVGSVMCVQGEDIYNTRNACRMICGFVKNIRCIDGGPGLSLVQEDVLKLKESCKGLRVLIHHNKVYIHCANGDVVNKTLQNIQNILAAIREDDLGDVCSILMRSSRLNKVREELGLSWKWEDQCFMLMDPLTNVTHFGQKWELCRGLF
eukprot:UN29921